MDRSSQITSALFLSWAIAGCTIGGTPEATNTTIPTPQQPVAVDKKPGQLAFKNPIVPSNQEKETTPPNNTDSGLIQSTSPTQRLNILSKGRPDPFAALFAKSDTPELNTLSPKKVPILPPLPKIVIKPQIAKNIEASKHLAKLTPKILPQTIVSVLPKQIPPVIPSSKLASILPPAPEPDSARAVTVTGILLIGREPEAIIKVPNEPTSRYVQVGQRLFNGGVLVKRIEMNQGSNPLVIFEQYGIEVARAVGEKPVNSSKQTTPSA